VLVSLDKLTPKSHELTESFPGVLFAAAGPTLDQFVDAA
jgi:hypothetical protein